MEDFIFLTMALFLMNALFTQQRQKSSIVENLAMKTDWQDERFVKQQQ